jgi:hypothetical protein
VRQVAVEEAQGDWILALDPDEEIDGEDLRALLAKTCATAALAFRVPRYDYIGSHGWALSRPCRLFRRSPKPNYVGAVYEEPFWPDGPSGDPETAWGVTIHHSGFLQPETHLLRKRSLYRTLSEQETPAWEGVWRWRNRAMLVADAGDWNHALTCAQEALRLACGAEAASLSLMLARLWMAVGHAARGLDLLRHAERSLSWDCYQHSRLQNLTGLLLLRLGRWREAGEAFATAVRHGYPVASYLLNWAVARLHLGEADAALETLAQAKALNPRLGTPRPSHLEYQDRWVHRLDTTWDRRITRQ